MGTFIHRIKVLLYVYRVFSLKLFLGAYYIIMYVHNYKQSSERHEKKPCSTKRKLRRNNPQKSNLPIGTYKSVEKNAWLVKINLSDFSVVSAITKSRGSVSLLLSNLVENQIIEWDYPGTARRRVPGSRLRSVSKRFVRDLC